MRGSYYYLLKKKEPTQASQRTVFDSLTVCQLGRHAPQPYTLGQEKPAHPQRGKLLKCSRKCVGGCPGSSATVQTKIEKQYSNENVILIYNLS